MDGLGDLTRMSGEDMMHTQLPPEYPASCQGCWFQEGGRCYVGDPPRNEDGVSMVMARRRCSEFVSKRTGWAHALPQILLSAAEQFQRNKK